MYFLKCTFSEIGFNRKINPIIETHDNTILENEIHIIAIG